MLLKMGVDISRLSDECRRSLSIIASIHDRNGLPEPVITSTYEGTHSPGSLHYVNRAYDVRLALSGERQADLYRQGLPKEFDVILESTHVHVEWDPE